VHTETQPRERVHAAKSVTETLSSRHWNVTAVALSVPVKPNIAVENTVEADGVEMNDVSGGSRSEAIGGPPSQLTLKHCSSTVLPAARLPPPSTFTPATVPAAA
jgi:hypothetical protein